MLLYLKRFKNKNKGNLIITFNFVKNISLMWVDIFKTGEHTDGSGNTREWTEEDLEEMVNLYNNQSATEAHLAPLVYGHPDTEDAALGWVDKLKRVGNVLKANFVEISQELINGIKSGAYKFQSIALYPNKLLRHVGILGAVPPAVKGLKPLSDYFSDSEFISYEFAENDINDLAKIKEYIKKRFGEEEYQLMLTNLLLNEEFMEKEKTDKTTEITNVKTDEFVEASKFAELQNKVKSLEAENASISFDLFYSELEKEGFLVPSQKELVKSILLPNYVFAEGKDLKTNLVELIKSFPKQITYSEVQTKEPDLEGADILIKTIKGEK